MRTRKIADPEMDPDPQDMMADMEGRRMVTEVIMIADQENRLIKAP